jgi:hypothetical protein
MDGSKLACERPARGPVQPMVRARLRGAIHRVDAVGPGPFTASRKRRRERFASQFSDSARGIRNTCASGCWKLSSNMILPSIWP